MKDMPSTRFSAFNSLSRGEDSSFIEPFSCNLMNTGHSGTDNQLKISHAGYNDYEAEDSRVEDEFQTKFSAF